MQKYTLTQILEAWTAAYGEDMTQEYPGFIQRLSEEVKEDVEKRSQRNNRRAVEAVKDAWTSSQPAGSGVQDWREAGEGVWVRMRGLLCPEGEIQIQECTSGAKSKAASTRRPALGGCDGNAHIWPGLVQVA